MNKLLKDAIADAKAVRETALANAKLALEEAFAPKIQSMLSHKIKEEMEGEEEEPVEEEEDMTMDMPSDEEAATESRMRRNAGIFEEDEEEDMPAEEAPEEAPEEEMPTEEEEMSDEELEEILRELEGDDEEDMTEEDEMSDEEDQLMEEEGEEDEEEEAPKTEARRKKKKMMENEEESSEDEEEVSIEEIIRALREGEDEEEAPAAEEKSEEELEEAYKVIKFLRAKLNEVNLLNAKLLFVNKLFKKANLSESKKMKVVETFDRVKSVREAKLVYATLCESLAATTVKQPVKSNKTSLKESFASRPSKGTRVINESNQVVNRFKELVNYNKNNF
jgi:hypothetical protein